MPIDNGSRPPSPEASAGLAEARSARIAREGGRDRRRRILIPLGLAAIYVVQCLWFVGTQSLTYDEPTHLATGLDAWRYGRYERWNDQPPLARLLLSMPLVGGGWSVEPLAQPLPGAFWTFAIRPSADALAWRTRPVNVALGVALAALLWASARRMFSEGGANVALALFAFSPPLIAHFSVAAVDGASTLLLFATAIMLLGWRRRPSWPATIAIGVVLGAFLIAKFSAPPMVLLTLAIMAGGGSIGLPLLDRLARALAAFAIALAIVWGAYQFHVGPLSLRSGSLTGPYAPPSAIVLPTSRPVDVRVTAPAPEYLAGLGLVAQHTARGQPSILLGRVRKTGGWRAYYPVVAVVKWPIVVWLIAIAVLVLIAIGAIAAPADSFVVMAFPIVYFALAIVSNLDIGDRYILPVYPFLLLLCAGIWRGAAPRRWAAVAIGAAVALHAIDAMRYAPDYLSYFNAFVRSDRPYEILSDSNLDWGQGLIAMRQYERAHPGERTWLAYFGGVDPREYGVRAQPFGERDHPSGTVVISATHLSGQYLADPEAFRWVWQYPLKTILNHTLYVFDVRQ